MSLKTLLAFGLVTFSLVSVSQAEDVFRCSTASSDVYDIEMNLSSQMAARLVDGKWIRIPLHRILQTKQVPYEWVYAFQSSDQGLILFNQSQRYGVFTPADTGAKSALKNCYAASEKTLSSGI